MTNYDLVIIGGGPAGTPVAMEYAKLNKDKKVALVDNSGKLGGECLFQGCIPSKILEATAKQIKNIRSMEKFGITLEKSNYHLIWEKVKQRKNEILNKRNKSAIDEAEKLSNMKIIKANATFINKNSIELLSDDKKEIITFNKAVIATGSHSFIPHYDGNGNDKIWTNYDFFAKMELPKSLTIIGVGAIAIEFAMILSTLGVKIDIFGRHDKILSNIDKEAREYLHQKLQENENVTIHLNSDIKKIDFENDNFTISFTENNETKSISSQRVLSAAGRIPNIDNLNLEKADVKYSKKGIKTDKHLQTHNENIYANGDVVEGFPKFAHTAQYGAHTLAQNLFLGHNYFSVNFDINSWVLFSMPNFASAGLNEDEARKREFDIFVDKFEFNSEAKSQIENEDYGYMKFVVDKQTKVILGISILHEEAHSMGGEASLIVANKLKLTDLISSIHPHPTISESFVLLAKKMMGKIILDKLENPFIKTAIDIQRWL